MITKTEYIEKAVKLTRAELLKACRTVGLAAYRIKTNRELAEILYSITSQIQRD